MEMQTATGLGEKNSWDILFQVNSVEKHLMFHRTNRCLGCVGYIYVGQIYQNRGESLGDFKYQLWLQKLLTLPLSTRLFHKRKQSCLW